MANFGDFIAAQTAVSANEAAEIPRAAVSVNGEAHIQAVMQELLKDYIEEVLVGIPLPPASGPAAGLEYSRNRGGEDVTDPINKLLCSTAQILSTGGTNATQAIRGLLERVLLDLSQRQRYGGEQQPLRPWETAPEYLASITPHEPCLTLYIRDQEVRVAFLSHVWEESIRTANARPNTHHGDAARVLLKTLEELLDASLAAYDPGTEVWHDYFTSLKTAIRRVLRHGGTPFHASSARSVLLAVDGKDACVMDESDYVWRGQGPAANHHGGGSSGPGAITLSDDTFTSLVRDGQTTIIGLFRHAKSFASSLKDGFLAGLTDKPARDKGAQPRNLCLGEALELIARTKSTTTTPIPESETEACRWDTTTLTAAKWDLGAQRAPPKHPIIVTENGAIETELDFVGNIQEIHYLDPEQLGEVAGVQAAIDILCSLDTSTRRLSAAELVDGLDRVFPFDTIHTMMAQIVGGLVYTLEARQDQDPRFTSKVERCIAKYYSSTPPWAGGPAAIKTGVEFH
ncbi:hypothetical protein B0H63DRAFT_445291 [Podospora didyma]|uniref:Uncharacterized protein n=1 Tax=Podospora didyma TaxID=330526 RepID=A0AAE0P8C8_9PEZI|nr:hypothetical protein B0H63DRAFT_445291 [Podospora didyma]